MTTHRSYRVDRPAICPYCNHPLGATAFDLVDVSDVHVDGLVTSARPVGVWHRECVEKANAQFTAYVERR